MSENSPDISKSDVSKEHNARPEKDRKTLSTEPALSENGNSSVLHEKRKDLAQSNLSFSIDKILYKNSEQKCDLTSDVSKCHRTPETEPADVIQCQMTHRNVKPQRLSLFDSTFNHSQQTSLFDSTCNHSQQTSLKYSSLNPTLNPAEINQHLRCIPHISSAADELCQHILHTLKSLPVCCTQLRTDPRDIAHQLSSRFQLKYGPYHTLPRTFINRYSPEEIVPKVFSPVDGSSLVPELHKVNIRHDGANSNLPWFRQGGSHMFTRRNIYSKCDTKVKKPRTSFTRHQITELEKRFQRQKYLSSVERSTLAKTVKMTDGQVKTWFQNRRTKWRRQTAEERIASRHASSSLVLSLHPDSKKTRLEDISDNVCMGNSSLHALQNLRPWTDQLTGCEAVDGNTGE